MAAIKTLAIEPHDYFWRQMKGQLEFEPILYIYIIQKCQNERKTNTKTIISFSKLFNEHFVKSNCTFEEIRNVKVCNILSRLMFNDVR